MSKKLYEYLERNEIASKIYIMMLAKEMSIKRLSIAIYGNPNQKKNIFKYIKLFKGKYIDVAKPDISQLRDKNSSREILYSANFEPIIDFAKDNLDYVLSKRQISSLRRILDENKYRIEYSADYIIKAMNTGNKDYHGTDWNAIKYIVSFCDLITGLIQSIKHDMKEHGKVDLDDEKELGFFKRFKDENLSFVTDIISLFYKRSPLFRIEEFAEITFGSEYLDRYNPYYDFTDSLPRR